MSLEIESLEIDDFDINDISLNDSIEEDLKNIIYSYPFYSDDDYDYEFRITFDNDNLILDEVKYNENMDYQNSIKIETNIIKKPLNELMDLINNNIDIRDRKTVLSNDILLLLNKNNTNFELELEENKKVVLKDLYKDIKDIII